MKTPVRDNRQYNCAKINNTQTTLTETKQRYYESYRWMMNTVYNSISQVITATEANSRSTFNTWQTQTTPSHSCTCASNVQRSLYAYTRRVCTQIYIQARVVDFCVWIRIRRDWPIKYTRWKRVYLLSYIWYVLYLPDLYFKDDVQVSRRCC